MTDAFRESLANHRTIVGAPTTQNCSVLRLAQHPTRRRRGPNRDELTHHQTSTSSKLTTAAAAAAAHQHRPIHKPATPARSRTMATKERNSPYLKPPAAAMMVWLALVVLLGGQLLLSQVASGEDSQAVQKQQTDPRSTQPTLDRQLESPSSSSSSSANSAPVKPSEARQHERAGPVSPKSPKPAASFSSQKRAAALAAQRDYDKYQLKASNSNSPARAASAAAETANTAAHLAASDLQKQQVEREKEKEKANSAANNAASNNNKQEASPSAVEPAHKKVGQLPNTRPHPKASAFSLLRKFLPSFMTSAAAAAAAASASSAVADKQPHQNQHSRSSPATSNSFLSSLLSAASSSSSSHGHQSSAGAGSATSAASALSSGGFPESSGSPLTGKIINLLTGAQKKKGLPEGVSAAIPNHAPFFMRKSATDRQAAGGGALALASGLLSNPLKLGLLFSAPLLPSLLLTPLAIAGLSPAMSAINNFFGDDDEPPSASSQSPLSALTSGSSSPLASILQATGASPFSSGGSSSSSSDSSSSGSSGNLALQAFQSLVLGPTSTTERPLFKPGMFASSSGIQTAAGAIGSAISSAASGGQQSSGSSSSGSSGSSNSQRPFFGSGGLMQAAASMISPSFAAPPSPSSSSSSSSSPAASAAAAALSGASSGANDDDGPGFIQMASDVFEKVANYMGNDNTKDGQAIAQASSGPGLPANSPLSTLATLSSMSPFQLSSLFGASPFGQAATAAAGQAASSSSSPVGNKNQRVGFFSTLRNVYELFSSSFLRRQEVGNENECQQRLVCELHQRAMNSKLFRRSLQTSLTELASLDKNLIEQIKYGSQALQARVDPDTKAMLNDFLKATNNFKSGREMINCSQMFPKCTRTQLLAAANAHLADPVNGRAIGKFSQLMKKMKFKANQQSTSQWKLRKPGKISASMGNQATRTSQPMDHMQVVPLQQSIASVNGGSQLTPADSLKLAQQIMMLSQLSQQQQQQPTNPPALNQYVPGGMMAAQQMSQQQQWGSQAGSGQSMPQSGNYSPSQSSMLQQQQPAPGYSSGAFNGPTQYSPAPKQQTTYTDAMVPTVYSSPTDSPYFMPQAQQYGPFADPNQPAAIPANQQQQQSSNNQQQGSSYQAAVVDQSMPQQQQPSRGLNMDNKNKPQQLLAPNKMAAIPA